MSNNCNLDSFQYMGGDATPAPSQDGCVVRLGKTIFQKCFPPENKKTCWQKCKSENPKATCICEGTA